MKNTKKRCGEMKTRDENPSHFASSQPEVFDSQRENVWEHVAALRNTVPKAMPSVFGGNTKFGGKKGEGVRAPVPLPYRTPETQEENHKGNAGYGATANDGVPPAC